MVSSVRSQAGMIVRRSPFLNALWHIAHGAIERALKTLISARPLSSAKNALPRAPCCATNQKPNEKNDVRVRPKQKKKKQKQNQIRASLSAFFARAFHLEVFSQ
jgi:hypothetical protein